MLTAVDLFCGAGGLTEGVQMAGFRVFGAVDNGGSRKEARRPACGTILGPHVYAAVEFDA